MRRVKIFLDRFVMDQPIVSRLLSGIVSASGLIILLAFVISIWFLWSAYMPQIMAFMSPISPSDKPIDLQAAGTFGDQFGGINALFTALALVGVIWTAIAQLKDRRIIEKQAFENTFFNMLTLLRQNYESVRVDTGVTPSGDSHYLQGDEAVEYLLRVFRDALRTSGLSLSTMSIDQINAMYLNRIHNTNESLLSVYFRTIYNLLRLIDRSRSLNSFDRVFYANLLRAQISSNAIHLIGLNAVNEEIAADFKFYIEKYRLLRYAPDSSIRDALMRVYDNRTFERRND